MPFTVRSFWKLSSKLHSLLDHRFNGGILGTKALHHRQVRLCCQGDISVTENVLDLFSWSPLIRLAFIVDLGFKFHQEVPSVIPSVERRAAEFLPGPGWSHYKKGFL